MTAVMAAPNGARHGKAAHPALPISVEEIVATAVACAKAGADAIHLHVRAMDGAPSLDPGLYREALDGIARATQGALSAQASTETVGGFGPDDIERLLRTLRPAAASVALRDLAPAAGDEERARALFDWARAEGVGLQHIVYAPADVDRLARLWPQDDPPSLLFVLGRYEADGPSDPRRILPFLAAVEKAAWPGEPPWMVCAFGAPETAVLATAAALGGHCRIGFENNFLHADGALAADNAERVGALRAALRAIGVGDRADAAQIEAVLGRRRAEA